MTRAYETTHQARKRFGQNFLHDQNIIHRIVKTIQSNATSTIIEIGPGLGALTAPLLASTPDLVAIEIDRDLSAQLRERFPQLHLIEGDALETNFAEIIKNIGSKTANIVGNLPYNISTPLIFHLLASESSIESMYFMLQREVVERMAALPGNKIYGKLSVMTQYHCDVNPLFHISPQCFHPVPKVESTFVQLKPRPFHIAALNLDHFENLVSSAFQQRRKTLRNAIKSLLPQEIPLTVSDKLSRRAEEISVAEYVTMSNDLYKNTATRST